MVACCYPSVTMAVRLILLLFTAQAIFAALVSDVRKAIADGDFKRGEKLIEEYRAQNGVTPESILALSWLGRGSLAAKKYDQADAYSAETRKLALAELKKRAIDAEKDLPLALGASMEVHAHVLDARGERDQAVVFLRKELATYRDSSMRARIQKNIHLLSLEGKPAPALEAKEWLGAKPEPLAKLRGKPVLMFFWAHWCGDCKRQAPILAKLQAKYGNKGLVIMSPTQRYGYVAGGKDAAPAEETPYIDDIRKKFYGEFVTAAPLSEENFKNYGVSTTPTLVLIDGKGIVRMYHPGHMSEAELEAKLEPLFTES